MISPQDIEAVRLVFAAAKSLFDFGAEWIASGKRPPPKRVKEVWSTLEQAKAKLDTDAAAAARWGTEEEG